MPVSSVSGLLIGRCMSAQDISEIASSSQETAEKVSAAHAAIMAVDAGETSVDVQKASDVLATQVEVWQQRHDRYRSGQTLMGISSGLTDLDAKIGGFLPGQLIVVAGRPAMGKTTFAMSCSIHAALKERKSVLALSLEMSNGQLIDRAVASVGKIPLNMIRNGTACGSTVPSWAPHRGLSACPACTSRTSRP